MANIPKHWLNFIKFLILICVGIIVWRSFQCKYSNLRKLFANNTVRRFGSRKPNSKTAEAYEFINIADTLETSKKCISDYFLLPEKPTFHFETFKPILMESKKVLRCSIPKNLLTQTKALHCRIMKNDSHRITDRIASNPSSIAIRGYNCLRDEAEVYAADPAKLPLIYNSLDWLKFAVIRDPIERFISGYLDRCLRTKFRCYNCGEDIGCFAKYSYDAFQKIGHKDFASNSIPEYQDHILPQYWYCQFSQYFNDYHFFYYNKTNAFAEEYRAKLVQWGYPEELVLTGWGENMTEPFLALKTKHTSDIDQGILYKNKIIEDLPTVNYMFLMYIVDYVKFNLTAPFRSIAPRLCANHANPEQFAVCNLSTIATECQT